MGIFTNLRASSPTVTIQQLEREIERRDNQIKLLKLDLSKAKSKIAVMQRERPRVTPLGDMDEGYECPECGEIVTEDYNNFCQRCGVELNWDWSPPCDEDAFDRWADR